MLFHLRKHRKALAGGLASLLFASWMALFCGACLADTAPAADVAPPCHDQPSRPGGCCDHGNDCPVLALPDAPAANDWSLIPETQWIALLPATPVLTTPRPEPDSLRPFITGPPATPKTPAYLRYCSLLN